MNSKLYRFFHKFTPKLVRYPQCNKRFFLSHAVWSYDKYLTEYSGGIHGSNCNKCMYINLEELEDIVAKEEAADNC